MMRIVLLTIGLALTLQTTAQTTPHEGHTCAAQKLTKQRIGQPDADLLRMLPRAGAVERGGTYTIPVVVHVVWNTAAENVSTASIHALIDELNEDYSGTNADLSQVRPPFAGAVGNVGFQFCLAQMAPDGSATDGIVRVQTTDTWFNPDTETDDMKFAPTGSPAWNPARYLNIWICDITSGASGSTVTVGYAYLPVGGVVGEPFDGLVIDYSYGMQPGARTATHEIGHYFGLLHPFDEDGSCTDGDGFTDTPVSNSPTFSCANSNLMKCGQLNQYENFMDYSNCTVMFTQQQSDYMSSVLLNERSSLLTSNGCFAPTYCAPISQHGTSEGDYINRVALGTINNANSGGVNAPTYTDFSANHSTSLTRGTQYTLTVQGGTYHNDHVAAWIDYDQDETFGTNERLGDATITEANQTVTISFTVPAGALLGDTRLRVRNVFHNEGEPVPTDPCYHYAYGETEDYGITITASGTTGVCIPTSTNGTSGGDFVNGVTLNTIANEGSGGIGEPTYTNFSSTHSTTLVRNGRYGIIIQAGDYDDDRYAVWIDRDQDGQFAAGEKIGEFSAEAGASRLIPLTVDNDFPLGNTTMRVRGVFVGSGEPDPILPCHAYAYGETEDYRVTIAAAPHAYCSPYNAIGTIDGDFINSVTLAGMVNLNTGGISAPRYTDYSSTHSATLSRGSEYSLVIEAGEYQEDTYTAWIDFNQDGAFSAGENLGQFTTTAAGQTREIPFSVPQNAAPGQTRMRVRGGYLITGEPTPFDPCHAYAYGETEDYRVMIQFGTDIPDRTGRAIGLWPNPATNTVTIDLPSDAQARMEIVDMQGRVVLEGSLRGPTTTVDVSQLASATYMVRVQQEGAILTQRLEILAR